LAFIIILIIVFGILKILELYAELPQKIMPVIYSITYIVNMFFKFWGTSISNYYAFVICKWNRFWWVSSYYFWKIIYMN